MKKITIVNAHWSNRGDEAALRPIINCIRDEFSYVKMTILFKEKKEISYFPYKEIVDYFLTQCLPDSLESVLGAINGSVKLPYNLQKIIDVCSESDLLIYSPGGAVISDSFWWKKQIEYLIPFMVAKKNHIPIIIASPSIGPFEDDEEKNTLRRELISYANKIYIREPISAGYLTKIGVDRVETTIDTSFYDEPDIQINQSRFEEASLLVDFFKTHNRVVAMTLSDYAWNVRLRNKGELSHKINESIRKFIELLLVNGYGVLLIPQLFGNQNDSEYLRTFLDSKESIFLLDENLDTYFQQFIISKCYAEVGMRYHSNIFAAKMGTPFIAIGYEEKMYGFMEQWGLDDYLIRINEFDDTKLRDVWEKLVNNHLSYHNYLSAHRKVWREKASVMIRGIREEIEKLE